MRPGGIISQARVWRGVVAPLGKAWQRRRLGRPLAAGLVLVLIGGAVTTARSLLELGDGTATGTARGWPTAVAGSLAEPAFSPVLVLPGAGESVRDHDLEAALARLKAGAFGVTFEALPAEPGTADAAPEARFAPVVLIDASLPPLRLDIMGLGVTRRGGGGGPLPEPAP